MKKMIIISLLFLLSTYLNIWYINILIIGYGFYLVRDKSILILVSLILINGLFIHNSAKIPSNIGKIIDIKSSYYLIQDSKGNKYILYSDIDLNYDMEIQTSGEFTLLEQSPTNYSFNFQRYMNSRGYYYQINDNKVEILKQNISIRSMIYSLISKTKYKDIYKKLIFNINNSEVSILGILNNLGLLLSIFHRKVLKLLHYFFKDKTINRIEYLMLFFYLVFYHINYVSFRLAINKVLNETKLTKYDKVSCFIIASLLLYPYINTSMAFIYPLFLRLNNDNELLHKPFLLCFLQNIFSHQINIISALFYRYISSFVLYITIYLGISELIYLPFVDIIAKTFSYLDNLSNLFIIHGYLGVIGLTILTIMYIFLKNNKNKYVCLLITVIFIIFTSINYPFASISFINIGQGNATLISLPFRQGQILIDTGKNSKYDYLFNYLKAKGINTIDYLICSHSDEDHCGAKDSVISDFIVKSFIDTHFDSISLKGLTLYDINDYTSDDPNESSIVIVGKLNNLSFCIPGDIDKNVESMINMKYDLSSIDILEAAHHGSNTSNSNNFLSNVRPKLFIISSGLNNMYNHPSKETIQNLLSFHIPYLNTAYDGDISIYLTKIGNYVLTSTQKVGIIN